VGVLPSEAFLTSAREQLTAKGSSFASSMFREVQRGWPIEVENIIGDLLHRGAKVGIAAPLLLTACLHLFIYKNTVGRVR
jgi:2-dehydropantoate 2-reductase